MKKRTKYLLVPLLCFIFSPLFAQKVGLKGGFNLSNQYSKFGPTVQSDKFMYEYISGWHAAFTFEQALSKIMGLETGIYFTTKGFKSDKYNTTKTLNYEAHYIEFPLELKLYQPIGKSASIFIAAGPYVGLGISGEIAIKEVNPTTGVVNQDLRYDIKWGDDAHDSSRRADFGASMGAGVNLSNIELKFTYRHTLNNLSPYDHDNELGNRVLMFSLGYIFQL